MADRDTLIDVFKDTEARCQTNDILRASIETSKRNQFIVFDGPMPNDNRAGHRFSEKAVVEVKRSRTFETAEKYAVQGIKTCVLNFANAYHVGGGVKHGARAQEESLCRCSTLYDCISDGYMQERFYNLHRYLRSRDSMDETGSDDCIYTPDVTVFKLDTDEPELLPEDKWYKTDVITCAAPKLSEVWDFPEDRLKEIHMKRGRRILELAKRQNADVIILGAFGCGAFRNDPRVVAEAYKEIIPEYLYDFRNIVFAIYARDYEEGNYKMFNNIIGNIQ